MSKEIIKEVYNELVNIEDSNNRLESASLILNHLIQDLEVIGNENKHVEQTLIKLRGIHCITNQVHQEVDKSIDFLTENIDKNAEE